MITLDQLFNLTCGALAKRKDTLEELLKFEGENLGIEGWFRVEIITELKRRVFNVKVRGRGPDLEFSNMKIELKASVEPVASWIEAGFDHNPDAVLFLGREEAFINHPRLKAKCIVSDTWIVGLLV